MSIIWKMHHFVSCYISNYSLCQSRCSFYPVREVIFSLNEPENYFPSCMQNWVFVHSQEIRFYYNIVSLPGIFLFYCFGENKIKEVRFFLSFAYENIFLSKVFLPFKSFVWKKIKKRTFSYWIIFFICQKRLLQNKKK